MEVTTKNFWISSLAGFGVTIPANLPYPIMVGIWHSRKTIRQQQMTMWMEMIGNVLPAFKPGV